MKRKNGFTLIELLAVIVILAIIAVIAVPIVINIIDESKENAGLRSAEMYLDAVEMAVANRVMHDGAINDGAYSVMSDGNICLEYKEDKTTCEDKLTIEVKGEKPTSGSIVIENGEIANKLTTEPTKKTQLVISGQTIVKNDENEFVYQEGTGAVKLCTANTTQATAFVYSSGNPVDINSYTPDVPVGKLAREDGAYTAGVAYTCNFIDDNKTNNMTFFVLSSTEDSVTLILGANLGETVAWRKDGSNQKGESEDKQAATAKEALASGISTWEKIKDMDDVTVKMPTAYDIAEAVGETFSDSSMTGLPTWLNSYTKTPVAYGYWTSTPDAANSSSAWRVYGNGYVGSGGVDNGSLYGVRPVIIIPKSNIK